jgi:hypothetical protein
MFEQADLTAQRRLRYVETGRCASEVKLFGYSNKTLDLSKVKHRCK